jgi:hypothetical protein
VSLGIWPSGRASLSPLVYCTTALITALDGGSWSSCGRRYRPNSVAIAARCAHGSGGQHAVVTGGVSIALFGHRHWRLSQSTPA